MASIGTIITRIYASQARLPIQGATVAFTQGAAHERQTLLAVRVSDANGQTAPVRLTTPSQSQGTSPGGETPYALCNIWAEAPGYEYHVIQGIQVFPGTETIQEIELTPLPLTLPNHQNTDTAQITPQEL